MSQYKKWSEIRRSKGAPDEPSAAIAGWMKVAERLYAALEIVTPENPASSINFRCFWCGSSLYSWGGNHNDDCSWVEARAVLKSFE